MNKSKIIKVITILLIMFITIFNLNIKVFADTPELAGEEEGSESYSDASENPIYYYPNKSISEPELEERAEAILGIINVIGVVISVITLMIIGIKYMFGSVEEKAEYKKTMVMYLIGAFLVFSVTTIPNILYKIGKLF